jgi:hypothetical protein
MTIGSLNGVTLVYWRKRVVRDGDGFLQAAIKHALTVCEAIPTFRSSPLPKHPLAK